MRPKTDEIMVTELIIVWGVAVVAFFVLWALLVKVVHRIGERKEEEQASAELVDKPDNEGKDEEVSGEIQ